MILDPANFVTTEIHARKVLLGDGQEHELHFRELPNTDLKRYAMWQTSEDEDVRAASEAKILSIGLVNADGSPAITFGDACRLRVPVLKRLVTALLDVNGYGVPRAESVDGDADSGKP